MPIIFLTPPIRPRRNAQNDNNQPEVGKNPGGQRIRQRLGQRLSSLGQRVSSTQQNLAQSRRQLLKKEASRPGGGLPGQRPGEALPGDLLADFFSEPPASVSNNPTVAVGRQSGPVPPPPPPAYQAPTRRSAPARPASDFELPENLADLGVAVRRPQTNRFQTPGGRSFVAHTTGTTALPIEEPPAPPPPQDFNFTEPERYISMFSGEMTVPNVPSTVADEIRQKRPGTQRTRVIGASPFTDLDDETNLLDETVLLPTPVRSPDPTPVDPKDMIAEPTYDPNKRGIRRRGGPRRQMLRFRNPAMALGAGLLSITILAGMVFLLFFLSRNLERAQPSTYSVMFANFGEGRGLAPLENGQIWARTLSDNFVQRSTLSNPDVRLNTALLRSGDDALRTVQRVGSDVVVWGYYEPRTAKLFTTLTLAPNGPFDPPNGRGRQMVSRHLYEPEQLTFVTAPPPDDRAIRVPLTQLLAAVGNYYNGNYEQALADLTQLLGSTEPANHAGLRMLRGNVLFAFGKYNEALEDYNQVISINDAALKQNVATPVNPAHVYNNRAVTLNFQSNYPEANKSFDTALGFSNQFPKIFANYAQFLLDRTDMQYRPVLLADWQDRLSKTLIIDPKLASGHYNLGRVYYHLGNYDEAIKSFAKTRELDANYLEAYYEEGASYLAKNDGNPKMDTLNAALTVFRDGENRASGGVNQNRNQQQTLAQNGNLTLAAIWNERTREAENELKRLRFGVARTYLEQARLRGLDEGNPFDRVVRAAKSEKLPHEEAKPRLSELVVNNPNDPEANFYHGQWLALSSEGDPQPYYRKAKDLEKDLNRRFKYHDTLAQQYFKAGKNTEALAEYTEYVNLDKNRVQGWLALSALQYQLGQAREAAISADNAIRITPNDARAYLAAGAASIKGLQLEQGVAYLDRALTLNSGLSDAHLQRGIALFNLNRRKDALESFSKALALNDKYYTAHFYAGIIYYENLNDSNSALKEWEKAVADNPKYAEAWVKLGQVYSQQNQLDKAINAYNQAVLANDKDGSTYYYVGLLHETTGDLDKADSSYRNAIRLSPGLVNSYNRLAKLILRRGGKPEEAFDLAQKAAQIDPRNPEAKVALGDIHRARAEFDPAVDRYSEALNLNKEYPEAFYGRAAALLGKREYDRALADLAQALRVRPQWAEAYLLQGQVQIAKGQLNEANASFAEARRYNPDNAVLLTEIARLQEKRGNIDEAISSYESSLKLNGDNAEAHFSVGLLYFNRRNFEPALRHFQRAAQLNDKTPRIQYWLGRTYLFQKNHEQARNTLETMVKQEPNFIEAHYELGNAYRALGSRDKARDEYLTAVKLQPAYGPAWLTLGQVYEELVNLPQAKDAYQKALATSDVAVKEAAQLALRRLGV